MNLAFRRLGDATLAVIPPKDLPLPPFFRSWSRDPENYEQIISEIQAFRGGVYLKDGAIPAEALDSEGRDRTNFDYQNWHFILRNFNDEIVGCIRMKFHEPSVDIADMRIHSCLLRVPSDLLLEYTNAFTQFRQGANDAGLLFGEVGGWAVEAGLRRSSAPILLPIAGWSLCHLLGDAFIVGAATARHQSAEILKRLGGFGFRREDQELVPYFDSYFGCEMQILGFDSRRPAKKYVELVKSTGEVLLNTPVLVS